jgi:TP53 regulating kinase-like protein
MNELIQQGAEAKIFLNKNIISKQRVKKYYRHPILDDQIRTRRTKSESKLLTKALEAKVNVPKITAVSQFEIQIEYIKGERLSQILSSLPEKKQKQIMKQLGEQITLLHKNNIIHGDLTTSNIILSNKKIFIIDFGLGFISTKIEDKAVDIHLLKQALQAKHFKNHEKLFQNFIKEYKWEDSKKTIERLIMVEKRGRYKH